MADLGNPISATSRTYATILNDINTDSELSNKPNWWKRLWAGIGDVLSIWLNSLANLLFLRTSFTRQAVADLSELIDYYITAHATAVGYCFFYIDASLGIGIFPFTVTKANLKARSTGNLSVSSKFYEARANETFALVSSAFTVVPATDIITVASDIMTGHKCRVVTTVTLPVPLESNRDYYIIRISPTTIYLANTLAEAYTGTRIDITGAGAGVNTLYLFSKAVTVYQQETLPAAISLGVSDAITEWQEFDIPNKLFLSGTESITINTLAWTRVTSFVDSGAASRHYKIFPKKNNMFGIRFGDGTYGMIPPAFDIMALYSYGGGSTTNINSANRINVYAGGDSKITAVSNPATLTGGADEQSLAAAKQLGPLLLEARSRFITVGDGEALVLAYGGIAKCKINKNVYGVLSSQVLGIATGGGNPSAPLKAAIQAYLIAITELESVDVRFVNGTITSIVVTSDAHMKPGFIYTGGVDKYFRLAYKLFLSEAGQEIKDKYDALGIAETVTLINTIFTETFVEADYTQIELLVQNLEPRDFGDVIEESDIYTYIQGSVLGIDYMTITVFGGGLPMTLAADEITTYGALTLGEIP